MIIPPALKYGDKIAIISPATVVKKEYVDGAARFLESKGYQPVVMPHAVDSASGSYASSLGERTDDFLAALEMQDVRAILCARGGYGAMQIIPAVPPALVRSNPKWLIGFSDITGLHAMYSSYGVASLHAPMAKHLTVESPDDFSTMSLFRIIEGCGSIEYTVASSSLNIRGEAKGILRGGNLAVLNGLSATPFDQLRIAPNEDVILFLEDIAEPIYKIDRVMWRLYMAGTISRVKGLIIGAFTEYSSDSNFPTVEDMIAARLREWGVTNIPVAFGFPVGHQRDNYPMVVGSECSLSVSESGATVKMNFTSTSV